MTFVPIGKETPLASSRWSCDSVVRAPEQELRTIAKSDLSAYQWPPSSTNPVSRFEFG